MVNHFKLQVFVAALIIITTSCAETSVRNEKEDLNFYYAGKGVGPIANFVIEPFNEKLAESGKQVFAAKCKSCHRLSSAKAIGPGLAGVTKRRTPEWILNQILNPIGMAQSDSLAKELVAVYLTQMVPMGISEEQARGVLEYLRGVDADSSLISE